MEKDITEKLADFHVRFIGREDEQESVGIIGEALAEILRLRGKLTSLGEEKTS